VSELALGVDDRGREVSVHAGDRIVLRLPENPTTGYRWAGEIPGFLRVARDENEHGVAPGSAGYRVMELVATGPGRAELALACARAWAPESPNVERFSVTVEVG
jgi:predicted secreted protein